MDPKKYEEKIKEYSKKSSEKNLPNYEKRKLYSKIELLLLDLRQVMEKSTNGEIDVKKLESQIKTLESLSSQLPLDYVNRNFSSLGLVIDKLYGFIRFFAVWVFLAVASVFIALPCLFLKPLDLFLVKYGLISPTSQITIMSKCFIARTIIKLSGVSLITQGLDYDTFGKDCVLVCFSHASTMDAFIISATIPVRHFTLVLYFIRRIKDYDLTFLISLTHSPTHSLKLS